MQALRFIWVKYAALFPAIYFMLLGLFDISMDLWHHTITAQIWLNLILFIPIVFRNKTVSTIVGLLLSLLFAYFLLAEFLWFIAYLRGRHFENPFDTFVIGPLFIGFSLFCAAALVYQSFSGTHSQKL